MVQLSETRFLELFQWHMRFTHCEPPNVIYLPPLSSLTFGCSDLYFFLSNEIGLGWSWLDGATTVWRVKWSYFLCKCHICSSWYTNYLLVMENG